jgi:sarcosine oxidase subunit gamma
MLDRRGMLAIKGDLASDGLRAAVREATGVESPGPLGVVGSGRATLLWMAPDELLALVEAGDAAEALDDLRARTAHLHALVEDVSDMRAAFVIEGAATRDVLSRLTPADVSPVALPPGRVRRTRLGQVAAALWLPEEGRAEVLCFRSVADYVFALLEDAAASEPLGLHHVDG